MQRKMAALAALLVALTLVVSGCTRGASDDQVLRIATPYTIESLNPLEYSSDGDRYVYGQVQEALVDGQGGKYWPLLAESWSNPDDVTWVFKLRDNAYWHDGNEVYPEGTKVKCTAQDVVDVYQFILDPANKCKWQAKYADIIKSVEAVDETTVKFVTKKPYAFFLVDINRVPIFSMKAYRELGEDKFAQHPIGTGPFKFVEYKTDDEVVLERNDDYHIKPHLQKVIFKIIPDKSVAAIALQTGEVDIVLQVPPTEVDKVVESGKAKTVPNSYGWYRYAAFNFNNPLFQDKRVRQAIRMSIDMESIVEALFSNPDLAKQAYGPIPHGMVGYTDDWQKYYEYNPEKAKQLLADAGWKPGSDGILAKDGKPFKFVLKTPNDTNRAKLGVMIATQLKQIGIDCTPQAQEWATNIDDICNGNTEMFIMGGGSTVDGLSYLFHSEYAKGQMHDTSYKNPEYDALVDKAMATVDEAERIKLWTQAAEMTIQDVVHIPAYDEFVQIGISNRVKDFDEYPSVWLSLVSELRNVSITADK